MFGWRVGEFIIYPEISERRMPVRSSHNLLFIPYGLLNFELESMEK